LSASKILQMIATKMRNEEKVLRYIFKKEKVSLVQLQRDFSHRFNAKELEKILDGLEDANHIRVRCEKRKETWDRSSPYPWEWKKRKGKGRQIRRTCVAIEIEWFRKQKELGRERDLIHDREVRKEV